jgi:hypothetical protein
LCIAVVCRPNNVITPANLKRGWDSNPAGGGFAYVDFEKAYLESAEQFAADSPFLVHMRIRTSGAISAKNTHPFPIKGGALIHNGIMFYPTGKRAGNPDDRRSDTRVFAEDLHNILLLDQVKKAADGIHKAIGRSNKVAFLYDNKETFILGEDLGFWHEGIWYSNSGCTGYIDRSGGSRCEVRK